MNSGAEKTALIKPLEALIFTVMVALTAWLLKGNYYLLAPLPALAIIFFLILSRYPEMGYYMIIFMVPFDVFREALGGSLAFLSISKLLGIWLVAYVLFFTVIRRSAPLTLKSGLWPSMFIFLLINLLAALLSEYTLDALDNVRQLFIAYTFFAVTLVFVSEDGFRSILPKVTVVAITINSLLSVAGYLFKIPVLSMHSDITRASGLTIDPNFFAAMVIFGLPLAAYLIHSSKGAAAKLFYLGALFINIAAVVFSFSRSAARVMLVVLVLLAIEHFRQLKAKHAGFIALFMAAVLFVMALFIPASYWERQKETSVSDPSIGRRVSYTYVAWDIFKEHPFLGVGPGQFKEMYAQSPYAVFYGEDNSFKRFAHNTYLEVLSGSGALGLLSLIAILFLALRNHLRAAKALKAAGDTELAATVRSYFLAHVAILICFIFLSNVYHKFFWVPVALSQLAARFAEQKRRDNGTAG